MFLHSATKAILQDFKKELFDPPVRFNTTNKVRQQYQEIFDWFEQAPLKRPPPILRDLKPEGQIQGDILSPYRDMTHSCLLLMRVIDQGKAAEFLEDLGVTKDSALPQPMLLSISDLLIKV